jgi:hypothetical protein
VASFSPQRIGVHETGASPHLGVEPDCRGMVKSHRERRSSLPAIHAGDIYLDQIARRKAPAEPADDIDPATSLSHGDFLPATSRA